MSPTINFAPVRDGAKLPVRGTTLAAGLDFFAPEDRVIDPGKAELVPLGLAVSVPEGYCMMLLSRSGQAKVRVSLANRVGLIDEDYRDELGAFVENSGWAPYVITKGMRICQGVLVPVGMHAPVMVQSLPPKESDRVGGWGSSGGHAKSTPFDEIGGA